MVRFANPGQLTAVGPTLYSAPAAAGLQNAPGRVLQGHREGSNSAPADAMVRMILGARYYEAAQRLHPCHVRGDSVEYAANAVVTTEV